MINHLASTVHDGQDVVLSNWGLEESKPTREAVVKNFPMAIWLNEDIIRETGGGNLFNRFSFPIRSSFV